MNAEKNQIFIRISHVIEETLVLGPGCRYVIWTQGCDRRCPGCINPAGQNKESGEKVAVSKLLQNIACHKNIDGVTISGGEPFLQLSALEKLVCGIKNDTGLDIMIYTGYCLEELFQYFDEEKVQKILACTDLLVDGEYKEELDHGEMYRGSANQKIYSPSGKYQKEIEAIEQSKNRDVEFDCSEGEIFMVGIPPKGFYQELLDRLIKANN